MTSVLVSAGLPGSTRLAMHRSLPIVQSTCRGREEAHELVTDECRGLLRGSLIAVHAQYVKTGLDQSFGRLPVEMSLGMAAAGRELKAIMRAMRGQPLR